jgi:hypothetical protein
VDGLGCTALAGVIVGVVVPIPNLAGAGVVLGLITIMLSRALRRRARDADDDDHAAIGRLGEVMGWLAVGPAFVLVLALVVLVAVIVVLLNI